MPKRNRPFIALECEDCHASRYTTSKNPKNTTERLVLRKYCKVEKKYTLHREAK